MINFVIGILIFGYATYTLFRHVKKSSNGKCGACELKSNCSKTSCATDERIALKSKAKS